MVTTQYYTRNRKSNHGNQTTKTQTDLDLNSKCLVKHK